MFNLYIALFILLKVEAPKREQNKFDNKLNIKEARCWVPQYLEGLNLGVIGKEVVLA